MASYSFLAPRPANAILSDVDHIREIQWILAQLNPSLADDAPEDSKRLVPLDSAKTQYRFERLVGSTWNSVGKLMHDVDTLDGYHASISAVQNTIPVYNADAKLVGDLTGNANTATSLRNIRKFQIGGIASGGSVNFDGSADATIEITQLTVNNANDTAINGILTIKHGGTGGADAATARANLGVPAIDHSSTEKTFGVSSTTKYGHSIGSDTPNSTFTADKGYFFSPKGANDLNSSLRALIAEELATKFDRSGGTITSSFTVPLILKNTEVDALVADPSANKYISSVDLRDKNDLRVGYFGALTKPNGTIVTRLMNMQATASLELGSDNTAKFGGNNILTSAGGILTGPIYSNLTGANRSPLQIDCKNVDVTTPTSESILRTINVVDANSNIYGTLGFEQRPNGEIRSYLRSRRKRADGTQYEVLLTLHADEAGTGKNVGRINGNEIITSDGGTVSKSLISTASPFNFRVKSLVQDKTSAPSENSFAGIEFQDKNNARVAWMGTRQSPDGLFIFEIQVMAGGGTLTIKSDGSVTMAGRTLVALTTDNKIQFPNGTQFWVA